MPCTPCVKKIINNGNLIAHLAPVLRDQFVAGSARGAAADRLSIAANTYRAILRDFGVTADVSDFDGCDQAQTLVKWITTDELPNVDTMDAWTAEIWFAINELAAGKLP